MENEPHFEVFPRKNDVDLAEYERWEASEGESPKPVPEPTGDFGWRFRAANGQITAIGVEAFTRREDARRAVRQFLVALADTGVDLSEAVPVPPIIDVDE